jgi:hypothetical protein
MKILFKPEQNTKDYIGLDGTCYLCGLRATLEESDRPYKSVCGSYFYVGCPSETCVGSVRFYKKGEDGNVN